MAITVTIDGRKISVDKGTTVLQAARDLGIEIPTLCHSEAVEPYGACRVCIVEASDGKRWSKVVTSCNYEVWEGLEVSTKSEPLVRTRREILDLVLSAHPGSAVIRELAARYGVHEPSYPGKADDDCILCGLCVRVCEQVVGVSALGFANRGPSRRMTIPFEQASLTCIGCGSCAYICPTRCLHLEDRDGKRILYKQRRNNVLKEFDLLPCASCGRPFLPREQLEHVQKTLKLPRAVAQTCPSCGGPK
ncbi:MAG: 2Fe-2S iron-sulfur cluster-binding protein [bacterium]